MLIVALFIIAKIWKQPKYPYAREWVNKLSYFYSGILLTKKKKTTLLIHTKHGLCQTVGMRYKRIHSVWLHLYEVQEQTNTLMVAEGRILFTVCQGNSYQLERSLRELSGVKEMLHSIYIILKVIDFTLKVCIILYVNYILIKY